MDEVQMVREYYPEPAAAPAGEVGRLKALLAEPPRRSRPRLGWGLGGLVVVGAAATVAVTLVGGNTPVPGPVNLNGTGTVLAAAAKAEQQPMGRYWYSREVAGQSYIMRPKTGTYAVTGALGEMFSWSDVRPGAGGQVSSRDLPTRPLTERDAAQWRRAGSPSSFRVWSNDHYTTFTTKATSWQTGGIAPENTRFLDGRSVEDIQRLPTDQAKLTEMFLTHPRLKSKDPVQRIWAEKVQRRVTIDGKLAAVGGFLRNAPVQPKVRAGLMRALAAQPGIHEIGRATDPLGRAGVALASDDRAVTNADEYGVPKAELGTYRYRSVVIFDERTGAVLSSQDELTKPGGPYAEMKPGFVTYYAATLKAGWTDAKPQPPAGLPFD
ncbi:CU044_5270 family protein [Actinomadura xylanilytica]|uniref:CU044_5270 family protein n=1 Tax=Actinomadura xylanilytica TaxID=887459 RepID=UPI00255B29D2|nr:CU044_5270 family protein [Actinomadura xylanilytica]MDL4773014.1 CU044_5270 family protein [Actinomadura xylanilytica]